MRLITIPFSHFNERARWALDRFEIEYDEEPYMPLFHIPAVARATKGRGGTSDRHSSRFSTPVLLTDTERTLADSGDILRWASDTFGTQETTLYPADQRADIEVFERRVIERLGGPSRRVAYFFALGVPGLLAQLAERNVGPRQARAFRVVAPWVVAIIRRGLEIDTRYAASLSRVREYRSELDALIGTKRYLFADRFTAADLTLASMWAPLILPTREEGYGAALPTQDELPEAGAQLVREMRESTVGQFCLRMFGSERGRRPVPVRPSQPTRVAGP